MTSPDLSHRITEAAKERYLAGNPEPNDPLILLLAHHEERCEVRHAELIELHEANHDGNGASKRQLAGIGAACAAAAAGFVEGLRRAFGG